MNERAPQFRDMKHDEDTLIVFVIRLLQLCQKRYRWSSPVNTTNEGRVRVIHHNIAAPRRLREVILGADTIFNLAGEVSHSHSMRFPKRDALLNATAQLNFLEECSRCVPGVRIVAGCGNIAAVYLRVKRCLWYVNSLIFQSGTNAVTLGALGRSRREPRR